ENDRISWVGPAADLSDAQSRLPTFSAGGRTVIPGLVDCHTHLAFGGWRADEFQMRIEGRSYLDIAASGGGIQKTMGQTRLATHESLLEHCLEYTARSVRLGVTAMECKTGYGLSFDDELKVLRVYAELKQKTPLDIVSTLLAAHVVPKVDPSGAICNRESYIKMICDELIPAVAMEGLAEFNDIFVEQGAFTADDARRVLQVGQKHGLKAKLHVDQLGDGNGGKLAAELTTISADHLEYTSPEGIRAMAHADVVAVCLPFASLYLNQPPMKARAFLDAGVDVAVATDFNPGSAPSYDLPLAMMLACTMSRMTPAEALKGATLNAARAISREQEYGSIEIGKRANFVELTVPDVNHWMYHFQPTSCVRTWIDGNPVFDSTA
ncbi:MAG: imidazolonepropionase, partial [Bacteroidetes Order II. Incertae sedis bacterium]|nr:imidazolonepropionase [Bacteroidetes Order II. bacterium]